MQRRNTFFIQSRESPRAPQDYVLAQASRRCRLNRLRDQGYPKIWCRRYIRSSRRRIYLLARNITRHLPRPIAMSVSKSDLISETASLAREWAHGSSVHDRCRCVTLHLQTLAENLAHAVDPPCIAMANMRTLLCTTCQRKDAAPASCSGVSLERCPLLKARHEWHC